MGTDNKSKINFYLVQGVIFLFLLAGITIIIAGFMPLRLPFFQRQTEKMVKKIGADSCTIASVEVKAWKTVVIRDIRFRFDLGRNSICMVNCKEMRLSGNMIQFYLTRNNLEKLVRKNKKALLNRFKNEPEQAIQFFLASVELFLRNSDVSCSGTTVYLKNGKKEMVSLKSGTFFFGKRSDSLLVDFTIASATIFGDGIENISGNCSIDNQGLSRIVIKKGTYCDGDITAEGTIDVITRTAKRYFVNVTDMDFNYWYTMHVGIGSITGRATIRATGTNRSLERNYPIDSLSLLLSAGKIEKLPVQQSLATSLFLPELSSLNFTVLSGNAVFDTTDTIALNIIGKGPDLNFSSKGWNTISGTMHYRMDGTFTREKVKRFPAVVRKMLVPTSKGGGKFGCRIYGNLNDPRFELDKETLQRAIGSMFDDFKDELIKMYR